MTAYNQALKHWKNPRKDRYTQECAPIISATSGGKSDYIVSINGGNYIVTAFYGARRRTGKKASARRRYKARRGGRHQ